MAAAEYLNDRLGTLAIDADAIKGFGVDNCVVTGVTLSGGVRVRYSGFEPASPGQSSHDVSVRCREKSEKGYPKWRGNRCRPLADISGKAVLSELTVKDRGRL